MLVNSALWGEGEGGGTTNSSRWPFPLLFLQKVTDQLKLLGGRLSGRRPKKASYRVAVRLRLINVQMPVVYAIGARGLWLVELRTAVA